MSTVIAERSEQSMTSWLRFSIASSPLLSSSQ